MDQRTFAISTISALGLSLTTGCGGEPLIGAWTVDNLTVSDTSYDMPFTYEEDGMTLEITGAMTIGEDLTGDLTFNMTATVGEEDPETTEYTHGAKATRTDKGLYTLETTESELLDAMNLSCTLNDTLVCTGETDGEAVSMTFSAAE